MYLAFMQTQSSDLARDCSFLQTVMVSVMIICLDYAFGTLRWAPTVFDGSRPGYFNLGRRLALLLGCSEKNRNGSIVKLLYPFLAILTLSFFTGCGQSDLFPTSPASGFVKLNGQPLIGAHVWLIPKSKEHNDATTVVRPQGMTSDDGKFVLTTYLQNDGAPIGEYDAIVLHGNNDPDVEQPKEVKTVKTPNVPMHYKDAKTSGLVVKIKKGENVIPLELKSR